MKKILCLGHASYDITIPMDKYPTENIKYRVLNRIECGGGPASNAAYLLGKWGMNTYFSGVLGNDIYGKRIKKNLKIYALILEIYNYKKNIKQPIIL